ncbi:MAG: Rho termination factor N-terminal domain-containing protein, partial [Actinomycetota bacterium]
MTDTTDRVTAPAAADVNGSTRSASGLSTKRLPELQAIAAELGISGTGKMRKSDLVAAIGTHRSGGAAAPARVSRAQDVAAEVAVLAGLDRASSATTAPPPAAAPEQAAVAPAATESRQDAHENVPSGEQNGGRQQRERPARGDRQRTDNRGNRSDGRPDNRGDNRGDNRPDNRGDNRPDNRGDNRPDNRGDNAPARVEAGNRPDSNR